MMARIRLPEQDGGARPWGKKEKKNLKSLPEQNGGALPWRPRFPVLFFDIIFCVSIFKGMSKHPGDRNTLGTH